MLLRSDRRDKMAVFLLIFFDCRGAPTFCQTVITPGAVQTVTIVVGSAEAVRIAFKTLQTSNQVSYVYRTLLNPESALGGRHLPSQA